MSANSLTEFVVVNVVDSITLVDLPTLASFWRKLCLPKQSPITSYWAPYPFCYQIKVERAIFHFKRPFRKSEPTWKTLTSYKFPGSSKSRAVSVNGLIEFVIKNSVGSNSTTLRFIGVILAQTSSTYTGSIASYWARPNFL